MQNYTLKWLFFGFSGRIRRSTYIWSAIFFVALYAFLIIQIALTPPTALKIGFLGLAVMIMVIVSVWCWLALSIKRLHDMGFSGFFTVLMMIPMLAFLVFLGLCFWPGQSGRNAYGEPPFVNRN